LFFTRFILQFTHVHGGRKRGDSAEKLVPPDLALVRQAQQEGERTVARRGDEHEQEQDTGQVSSFLHPAFGVRCCEVRQAHTNEHSPVVHEDNALWE
jgi:hypothetical protein